MNYQSHEFQDRFVVKLQNYILNDSVITHKYFLEISAGHPVRGSNTYVLDTELGWRGMSFDIDDGITTQWKNLIHNRNNTQYHQLDVTSDNLSLAIQNYSVPLYDYVSLDVDNAFSNLSYLALLQILKSNIRFKIMTYEHESFKYGDELKILMREKLSNLGYTILFADVNVIPGNQFEDWIIDASFFNEKLLSLGQKNLLYSDIINLL